jgi:hypothetical protein
VGAITFIPAIGATSRPLVVPRNACGTAQLDIWLDTSGNGAAGSVYYDLEFTNLGARTCSLGGYPGVSSVDLAGRQIGSAANRNPAVPAKVITLGRGKTAIAYLQITDVANYPSTTCRPTTAAGIRVFPPNQTASQIVPYPFGACARTGVKFLAIENIKAS